MKVGSAVAESEIQAFLSGVVVSIRRGISSKLRIVGTASRPRAVGRADIVDYDK